MSEPRPHLDLPPATQHGFLNPRRGGSEGEAPPPRNRAEHAAALRRQIDDLALFLGAGETFQIWNPGEFLSDPNVPDDMKDIARFRLDERGANA